MIQETYKEKKKNMLILPNAPNTPPSQTGITLQSTSVELCKENFTQATSPTPHPN